MTEEVTETCVDVVVVSFNSSDHLRGCVEPIARSSRYNVIVVDNASTDGSVNTIDDLPVTVIAETSNRGFACGCNRGWTRGRARFVLFLNPDSAISATAIEALVSALDRDGKIGIVGPRIVNSDGSLALSQRRFPRVLSTFSEALYLHHLWPGSEWSGQIVHGATAYDRPQDAEWLSGACLLVRRELLERMGGFDERFFMYSEDTELCRAAWSLGHSVRFDPAATVVHTGGASASRAHLLPMLARSRMLYVTKNSPRPVALAHRVGLSIEAVTHAVVGKGGWARRRGNIAALKVLVANPNHTRSSARELGPV